MELIMDKINKLEKKIEKIVSEIEKTEKTKHMYEYIVLPKVSIFDELFK